ncbi:MAG: DUF1778 domain-containing protein [Candidatus Marinimicrobia bacterium]|nr:DUF1778 domain-containing protein [Candidatus Neomarinimicrobiota bacterium]
MLAKARFDTRLAFDEKRLFEKAASIGGYRSLTDFVLMAAKQKAKEIISESEKILASQQDNKIFFDALINPDKPNDALLTAAQDYKEQLL